MMAGISCALQRHLERSIQRCFYRLGLVIGRHPWPCLLFPVVLTAILSVGLLRYREINDFHEYTPVNAPSRYEYRVFEEFHNTYGRLQRVFMFIRATDGGSLLRLRHAASALQLIRRIERDISACNQSYADFCSSSYCDLNLPLAGLLHAYTLRRYLGMRFHSRLSYPIATLMGQKVYVANHLYKIQLDKAGIITSSRMIGLSFMKAVGAEDAVTASLFEEWERKVFRLFQDDQLNEYPLLQISVYSDRSLSLEIKRVGVQAMPLLALGLAVVLVFTIVTTLRCDVTRSKPLEASAGVAAPLLAIVATSGALLGIGLHWQPIVILTLILAVAVGVDDVYLIFHAWDQTECGQSSSEQRVGLTLQKAGPSITMTSVTNALAFLVGCFSGTPAVATFCTYSCLAMLFSYVFQVCLCGASLALRDRRQRSARFVTDRQSKAGCERRVQQRFGGLVELLMSRIGRAVVVLTLVLYWTISIYGFTLFKVDIRPQKLVSANSQVAAFCSLYDKYVVGGMRQLTIIVNNPGDIRLFSQRSRMQQLVNEFELENHSCGRSSTVWWFNAYTSYLNESGKDKFAYSSLPKWLNSNKGAQQYRLQMHINRQACEQDVPDCISAYKLFISYRGLNTSSTRNAALTEWRSIAGRYADLNVSVFTSQIFMADMSTSIETTTVATVSAASVCIAVICLLLIPNLLSVAATAAAVLSINVGVFGGLALWAVDLDPITMAALLMAVGFSVDSTAHIAYHFFKAENESAEERLRRTFDAVGWPMLQAGVSTVCGVSMVALSDAYVNRVVAKTVVLVTLLGLYHGLIVLPALLPLIPCGTSYNVTASSYRDAHSRVDEAHEALKESAPEKV